jgi:endogenous inhibitor of DNA gyrase (YacG/DUF329 family)
MENQELKEIKICPECGSPWNIEKNRCSSNCQNIDKE